MESKPKPKKIERPSEAAIQEYGERVGELVQPEWVQDLIPTEHGSEHDMGGLTSLRSAEHEGRKIIIKTSYQIEIDGIPFAGHARVDGEGRIHCHAIPYETYPSAIGFSKRLIDLYPESFPRGGGQGERGGKS